MPAPSPVAAPVTSATLPSSRKASGMTRSIAIDPHSRGDSVRLHAFQEALPIRNFGSLDARGACHVLIRAGLQEFANPYSARVAGRTASGQNVIRSDGF